MDGEPIANPTEDVFNQGMLKGIFDAAGTLSQDGEESVNGWMRNSQYAPPPTISWNGLSNIFVSQFTEKGKQVLPGPQDIRTISLNFENGEIEWINYSIYKEGNRYRIEKEEGFPREENDNPQKDMLEAVSMSEKLTQTRDLERKLGYAKVDAVETKKLLDLLNKLRRL